MQDVSDFVGMLVYLRRAVKKKQIWTFWDVASDDSACFVASLGVYCWFFGVYFCRRPLRI